MPNLLVKNFTSDERIKKIECSGSSERFKGFICMVYPKDLDIDFLDHVEDDKDYIYVDDFFTAKIKNSDCHFCIFSYKNIIVLSIIDDENVISLFQIDKDIDISNEKDLSFILDKIEKYNLL